MAFAPAALELILPNGTARYVALLTAEPNVAAGTYTQWGIRQSCDVWEPVADGRANGDEIAWGGAVAAAELSHWAIFDAAEAGNMLAAGPLLNLAGDPEVQYLNDGDAPGFVAYELVLPFEEV